MFLKSYQLMFSFTLMLGTLIAISANTWFTSWLGLEINLMSMLPLMLLAPTKPMVEASIKYFLVQAMASTLLIISVSLHLYTSLSMKMNTMENLVFFSLLMKAGIPPLHFWFPNIMHNLKWPQCFILFTWQKVAPLLLLTSCKLNKIITVTTISLLVGTLGGLNQLLLKTLLTYSSIAHSSWILLAASMNTFTCFFYFFIYCSLSASIIYLVSTSPLKKMNDLPTWEGTPFKKYTLGFNLLALGGLPPFLGFIAKLSLIIYLTQFNLNLLALLFVMMSLFSLFYYFRIVYSFALNKQPQKISLKMNTPSISDTILFMVISLNIFIPAMGTLL